MPLLAPDGAPQGSRAQGPGVASCQQFSHTPCGSQLTAAVERSGYRYASFGENLFAGSWGHVTPRDVVSAWLHSPAHRAILLSPAFRHRRRGPCTGQGLLGDANAVVWTATFASPSLIPAGVARPGRESSAVGEESHLDEMRSAIRGDFERLAERRGSQELMRLEEASGASHRTSPTSTRSPRSSRLAARGSTWLISP